MVEQVGTDYVMSRKPNPTSSPGTAGTRTSPDEQLVEFLEASRGCHLELIMKDISTVRYDPQRLWEWAEIAMEVAEDYAA